MTAKKKLRTMQHNSRSNSKGRVHGTKHNDRNFDLGLADNIDQEKSVQNLYRNCFGDPKLTFEVAELLYYEKTFGEQLRRINEKYIKNGHSERCKSMADWKQVRQNAPEETTMQIGDIEDHADAETLWKCYNVYTARLEAWNADHGNPFTTMTEALHVDEAVPHVQARRVWKYTDKDGVVKIGQEKALAQAGVDLPDPSKPEGRQNNRKITFDKIARTMWLDVLHEHGLNVEREALPNGKHNREKEDMIRQKYADMIEKTSQAEAKYEELEQINQQNLAIIDENQALIEEQQATLDSLISPKELEDIQVKKSLFTNDITIKSKDWDVVYSTAQQATAAARYGDIMQSENHALRTRIEQMELDAEAAEREAADLRNQQLAHQMRMAELEQRVRWLENQNRRLEVENRQLRSQLEQAQAFLDGEAGFLSKLAMFLPKFLAEPILISQLKKYTGMDFSSSEAYLHYIDISNKKIDDQTKANKALLSARQDLKNELRKPSFMR